MSSSAVLTQIFYWRCQLNLRKHLSLLTALAFLITPGAYNQEVDALCIRWGSTHYVFFLIGLLFFNLSLDSITLK